MYIYVQLSQLGACHIIDSAPLCINCWNTRPLHFWIYIWPYAGGWCSSSPAQLIFDDAPTRGTAWSIYPYCPTTICDGLAILRYKFSWLSYENSDMDKCVTKFEPGHVFIGPHPPAHSVGGNTLRLSWNPFVSHWTLLGMHICSMCHTLKLRIANLNMTTPCSYIYILHPNLITSLF